MNPNTNYRRIKNTEASSVLFILLGQLFYNVAQYIQYSKWYGKLFVISFEQSPIVSYIEN